MHANDALSFNTYSYTFYALFVMFLHAPECKWLCNNGYVFILSKKVSSTFYTSNCSNMILFHRKQDALPEKILLSFSSTAFIDVIKYIYQVCEP